MHDYLYLITQVTDKFRCTVESDEVTISADSQTAANLKLCHQYPSLTSFVLEASSEVIDNA